MKVKICGIKDVDTAQYAAQLGADAIGFVFAESKRKISPEGARKIIDKLPADLLKVGVFVNEKLETVFDIIHQSGLNAVQFHGDEPPEYCQQFTIPVIKAFSIEKKEDLEKIYQFDCDYALLDSPKGNYRGGNGRTFDWALLKDFEGRGKKIILAGGLNTENVEDAIEQVIPYMVDVSSGVETEDKKDLGKIKKFIEKAKTREEVK